jgi:hypothetical protein
MLTYTLHLIFAAHFEQNEEERISPANQIVMVRPDANRKRRKILACLTRRETMGRGSLTRASNRKSIKGILPPENCFAMLSIRIKETPEIGGEIYRSAA